MFNEVYDYPYTVDETVNRLTEAFQNESFGVLWDFDVKNKLDEKGVGLENQFRILEVCAPDIAKDMLNISMKTAYFLPCKVVVYEENGTTKAGMPRPEVLMELTEVPEAAEKARDVEEKMNRAFKAAK
ncbi:DUF302 domain-containing protein [Alkalicoccus chagannorensis]|uniref:DUF302 domain-containing protein n=1 Tax=Alkalicoccus chagannorensis TaxID=427072 RepID=UPI0003F6E83D|nr:DUF302 domain-containing protein [Alkalicoccus chagannorensis]